MNPGSEHTLRQRFYIIGNLWKERPSTQRLGWRHSISIDTVGYETDNGSSLVANARRRQNKNHSCLKSKIIGHVEKVDFSTWVIAAYCCSYDFWHGGQTVPTIGEDHNATACFAGCDNEALEPGTIFTLKKEEVITAFFNADT